MRARPEGVTDAAVLATVRAHWDAGVDAVEYLPVGFGAHHWRASRGGEGVLFVTLDPLGRRHDFDELLAAYSGAAALAASGLEFVHAGVPPYAVPFDEAALSATPWLDGSPPEEVDAATTRAMLSRLHRTPAPPIPLWQPVVPKDLAPDLAERTRLPWDTGPFGESSRSAIAARLPEIDGWVRRYRFLAGEAVGVTWVPTHGEPHAANQLVVGRATVLVDWESLKLAPAERDLSVVGDGAPEMLELFDLEWRLDEIDQYASWFAAPHAGSEDDEIAHAGLLQELERADRSNRD